MTNTEIQNNWHKDPNNWKYLFFYFNAQDARIIVPKKAQWMGITFNYAHKMSWVWTAFLLVVVGIFIYVLPNL